MSRGPLAQRRHLDRHHVQPVVQIFAKMALAHPLFQVDVRSRDDAHVHFHGFRAAQALEFALLQDAQEFGLQFERQFADLIQEQRAVVGLLKTPIALLHGAREGAFDMAEQLGFSRFSGSALQLTATMGCAARGLAICMARAAISLPVPVSPVISTVQRRGPTRRMMRSISSMARLSPTRDVSTARRAFAVRVRPSTAAWTRWRNSVASTGSVRIDDGQTCGKFSPLRPEQVHRRPSGKSESSPR